MGVGAQKAGDVLTDTVPRPRWMPALEDFQSQCRRRMISGMQEYGDKSFTQEPVQLIRELQQEAMDLHCWGFILWNRLEHMKRAALGLDALPPCPTVGEVTV